MKDENKQCSKCRKFNRYFTRGVKRFNETKYGWCSRKGGSVSICDVCDGFIKAANRRSGNRAVMLRLSDLLTEITAIRQVIESEDDKGDS